MASEAKLVQAVMLSEAKHPRKLPPTGAIPSFLMNPSAAFQPNAVPGFFAPLRMTPGTNR